MTSKTSAEIAIEASVVEVHHAEAGVSAILDWFGYGLRATVICHASFTGTPSAAASLAGAEPGDQLRVRGLASALPRSQILPAEVVLLEIHSVAITNPHQRIWSQLRP